MTASARVAPIAEVRARIADGRLSPVDLLDETLRAAEAENETSHAFITICRERARADLEGADPAAPLFGIPYSCKDVYETRGVATTCGSKAWEDRPGAEDAEAVARLTAAGACLLGKTNLYEFSFGATSDNPHFGTVPHPHHPTRGAGGSSSGAAYAVARGLSHFALGSDTGGSVRSPAAVCGLVGFKPSFARLATHGLVPFCWSLDHVGLLTRSVADLMIVFAALDGAAGTPDERPPTWDACRIGVPETFFFENCDGEILAAVRGFLDRLAAVGAELCPVRLEHLAYSRTASLTVQMAEAFAYHRPFLEKRGALYSDEFRAGLALGQFLLAEHYINAKRLIEDYRRQMDSLFREVDVLVTPGCPVVAPPLAATHVADAGIEEPVGNALTRYTSFFNLTGNPAITLPLGAHGSGLPMSVQVIAARGADRRLLAAARALETAGLVRPWALNLEG